MIKHAHGEYGIKGVERRKLFNTQRQQMRALVIAQQFTHRLKLAQEELGRIDTDRQMCARANHAPHVIATAATDIKNGTSGEIRQVRQDAIPLPVGTPFGIDIDAVQRVRSFTPWHQVTHQGVDTFKLTFA